LSLASPCLAVPHTSASVRAIRMRGMVAPFGARHMRRYRRSIIVVHACAVAGAITKIGRVVGR
jgi:hypothetical protein